MVQEDTPVTATLLSRHQVVLEEEEQTGQAHLLTTLVLAELQVKVVQGELLFTRITSQHIGIDLKVLVEEEKVLLVETAPATAGVPLEPLLVAIERLLVGEQVKLTQLQVLL